MVWCSGWRLASAVSNAGGLGLIGAGSMRPPVLKEHILKCQAATDRPFGVNVPLLYKYTREHLNIIAELGVKIVFTSAGNPATWTGWLKERGIVVVHVVPSARLAAKCEQKGVDAVVCEGFEAGGHNGREETTTFCLIPQTRQAVSLPVIAAGGIASGAGMAAAFALGADAVQVGSRFAISAESSAHALFKERVIESGEGETVLSMKDLIPVRLLKNAFYERVRQAEQGGASKEDLLLLLGKGRAKRGVFEGDLDEGELEIGQVGALIYDIPTAADIVDRLMTDFRNRITLLSTLI